MLVLFNISKSLSLNSLTQIKHKLAIALRNIIDYLRDVIDQ